MTKEYLPAGYYECPKCKGVTEVLVPILGPPTHRCGVGRKVTVMEYKGDKNAFRDSVRRLDTSD